MIRNPNIQTELREHTHVLLQVLHGLERREDSRVVPRTHDGPLKVSLLLVGQLFRLYKRVNFWYMVI